MDEQKNISFPPGYYHNCLLAFESKAYYKKYPYPYYGFKTWKTETLGPYPICLSIASSIINRSALWLFGKPIEINCNDSTAEENVRKILKQNKFGKYLTSWAKRAGQEGGFVLKFYVDEETKAPRIQFLSQLQVQLFYNLFDDEVIDKAIIQYPYTSPEDGKVYWFREDWTKDERITYKPLEHSHSSPMEAVDPATTFLRSINVNPAQKFEEAKTFKNKFGVVPLMYIKNIENGTQFGEGDCFGQFRIIDRINHSYTLLHHAHQKEIDPDKVYIDLEEKENEEGNRPLLGPGSERDLKSIDNEDGSPRSGKVQLIESNQKIKDSVYKLIMELTQQVFDATGAVFPRQEEVTNKGAMTQSVLIQMYAPLLEITEEKRKSYGEFGICEFINLMCKGLANAEVEGFKGDYEDLETNIKWFTHFRQTEDDKFALFDRIDREVKGGYINVKSGIEAINNMEEFTISDEDVTKLETKVTETIENNNGDDDNEPGNRAGNDPGGTEDGQKSRQQKRGFRNKDAN